MKCLNNKFIILVSIIALFNSFFILLKYDFKIFTRQKLPLNMFDEVLKDFKYNYSKKIRTIGFYTDAKGDYRIHMLYELQDSVIPIFIDDSIKHEYVLCFSDFNGCEVFAKEHNMEFEGRYNRVILCKRKGKK